MVIWFVIAVIAAVLLHRTVAQTIGDPYLFQGLTSVIVGGTTIMVARARRSAQATRR